MTDEIKGALSQLGGGDMMGKLSGVFNSLADPEKRSQDEWLAFAGGMGQGNPGGGLEGSLGGGIRAQSAYRQKADELQAQYMPHIMQAIDQGRAAQQAQQMQQQQQAFNRALANRRGLLNGFPGFPAAQGGVPAQGPAMPPPQGAPAQGSPQTPPISQATAQKYQTLIGSLDADELSGLMAMKALPAGTEKIWEIEKFGKERKPGDFVQMPDGRTVFTPMVEKGIDYDPENGIKKLKGSENLAALEGQKAEAIAKAQKTAEAPFTLVETIGPDGRPGKVPLSQALQQLAPAQGATPVVPQSGKSNALIQPGDTDLPRIYADALSLSQGHLAAAKTPEEKQRALNDIAGIQREINANGVQLGAPAPVQGGQPGGAPGFLPTGQSPKEKLANEAGGKINETWLKTSYEPVLTAGGVANDMLTNVQVARQSMKNMGGTGGWGTEAKAIGANVLTGMGLAPESAKNFAANAQTFQNAAMSNLQTVLNAAKGPQTEGDADRAAKTFAQLANTPKANEFILDLAEARAQRDQLKARFYEQALPIAQKKGDLQEVDREWSKRAPSIFSMPSMAQWQKGVK